LLAGEVYRPMSEFPQFLRHLDLVFAFEFAFAAWDDAAQLGALIQETAALERVAWVLSNHDFDRVVTRLGPERALAAAVVLLTLPGAAFVYQGDELGLANGEGGSRRDRAGRDGPRRPMQWDGSSGGGFTTGEPWLPLVDPAERNVADQEGDAGSVLALYRRLGALRPQLAGAFELVEAEGSVLAFRRGQHLVVANLGAEPRPLGHPGELVLSTHGPGASGTLAPFEARVLAV
jgi:glycosidase